MSEANEHTQNPLLELRALDAAHQETIKFYTDFINQLLEKIEAEKRTYSAQRVQLVHENKKANLKMAELSKDGFWELPVVTIAQSCGLLVADLRQPGYTCDITIRICKSFTRGLLRGQRSFQMNIRETPENFWTEDFDHELVKTVFTHIGPTLKERVRNKYVLPSQTLMTVLGALIHDDVLTKDNVDMLKDISWEKEECGWQGVAVKEKTNSVYGIREAGCRTYAHMSRLINNLFINRNV